MSGVRRGVRTPLLAGALAGPLYVGSVAIQAALRDGFDLTRHAASLLANGDLGWVQIATFVATGSLVIALAFGLSRADGGRAGRLIGVYGMGLIASGVFVADPAYGFPPGTPPGPPDTVSWHGALHLLAGGIGFLALIWAAISMARRFAAEGRRGWVAFSAVSGAGLLLGFGSVAALPGEPAATVALTAGVVLAWAWITALAVDLRGHVARTLEPAADRPPVGSGR